jgi:cell division septal protein FtsQ
MRDIEKTSMQHETNYRRTRRRKRGRVLYGVLVIILAMAAMATLSMTVFFNVSKIRVTGNAECYTAEEIVAATGLAAGDNMVRMNTQEAEERALDTLINVETISIHRQFPNTLVIDVQKCTPAYNVPYEYGTLIVSEHGKILENSMDPVDGLIDIKGYLPAETTPGKIISAVDEKYDNIFSAFRELIYEGNLTTPIVSVDMSETNDILVNFDNRIIFDMGTWSEISYKISFAEQIISEQPADKEGYLTMIGSNQCSFRNKSDVENSQNAAVEAESAEETDESGNPVTENGENTDSVAEE